VKPIPIAPRMRRIHFRCGLRSRYQAARDLLCVAKWGFGGPDSRTAHCRT
jgi:hypothetical protein